MRRRPPCAHSGRPHAVDALQYALDGAIFFEVQRVFLHVLFHIQTFGLGGGEHVPLVCGDKVRVIYVMPGPESAACPQDREAGAIHRNP